MMLGWIAKHRRRFAATLSSSLAALCFAGAQTFAEDLAVTQGTSRTPPQAMTVVAHASSGPLRCEIRKTETNGSMELSGVISSTHAVAGNFRFTVTKSGVSGSSNINQGNKFDLAADKESQVGSVRINLDHDTHAMVELFVGSNDGLECRAQASLNS
jgi:hypothetical protein